MSIVARIYLVRHGETDCNKKGIIQGTIDTDINRVGCRQALSCGEALKDVDFSIAFTSDLQRARQTARLILEKRDVPLCPHEGLRERYLGEMQGKLPGTYDRKQLAKTAEPSSQFALRTLQWWEETIGRHLPKLNPDSGVENVLAVSHGSYISTLCRALFNSGIIEVPPDMVYSRCYNTSITIIDMRNDKRGFLLKYCDISHLTEPVVETNADEIPTN